MGKTEFQYEVERIENYCKLQEVSIREWGKGPGTVVEEADPELARKIRAVADANQSVLDHVSLRKG